MIAPLIDELAVEYAGKLKAVRRPLSRPVFSSLATLPLAPVNASRLASALSFFPLCRC